MVYDCDGISILNIAETDPDLEQASRMRRNDGFVFDLSIDPNEELNLPEHLRIKEDPVASRLQRWHKWFFEDQYITYTRYTFVMHLISVIISMFLVHLVSHFI